MMGEDRAHHPRRWIGPRALGGAVGVGVGLVVLLALAALSAGPVTAQGGSTPAPAGTVVFTDDFEGGTLDRWLFADPEAATIVNDGGNRVLQLSRAGAMSIALPAIDATWTDLVVEASVQIVRAVGSNSAGDVFLDVRSNFADAGYSSYSGYISATNDRAGIGVIIEDTWIDALSGASFQINIAAGQWYTLRAEARGERIEWYVNDRLASWVVDRQIERGSFALFVPPGAEVFVDNVRVIDLTGAAGGSTGLFSGLGRTPIASTPTPTPSATATPSATPTASATPTGTEGGASATGTKETTSSGGSLFGGLGGAGTPATPAVALASTTATPAEALPSPTATPTPTPTTALEVNCAVEPLSQNVSLRHGPGTNYAREGTLAAGQSARVNGQAIGTDGLVWWRLTDDTWVRSDTVRESGNCEDAPTVTELSDGTPIIPGQPVPGGGGGGDGGGGSLVTITNPPSGIELRGGGSHTVSWAAVPGAVSYRVEVASAQSENPYSASYNSGGTSVSVNIGAMPARPEGWGYTIRVLALDGGGGVIARGEVYVIRRP